MPLPLWRPLFPQTTLHAPPLQQGMWVCASAQARRKQEGKLKWRRQDAGDEHSFSSHIRMALFVCTTPATQPHAHPVQQGIWAGISVSTAAITSSPLHNLALIALFAPCAPPLQQGMWVGDLHSWQTHPPLCSLTMYPSPSKRDVGQLLFINDNASHHPLILHRR
ncbi:unnamed protein product [Cyclocybe aegerita]|uniref:Uncharacterized protein n=1 Tax=Cyclocybe aegerita TaxID=1973307 RepID=A0A8S0W2D2_CYCAE|nr:unnamed protein product [Cyclocybe aegerita]